MLPYTRDVLLALFGQYNLAIWPAQWVAYALGLAALWLAVRPTSWSARAISAVLALLWGWNGVVYQLLHFSAINFWAFGFAILYLLQSLLFAWSGVIRGRLHFGSNQGRAAQAGLALMALALAVYPLLSWLAGHAYPSAATFGVTPSTTIIFTLGALITCAPRIPLGLSIIPFLGALSSGAAGFALEIPEDLTLWLAALVFGVVAVAGRRQ